MLHVTPDCELPADTQLFLYEAFETVAESCLDTLRLLLVNVTMRNGQPVLRIALKASGADAEPIRKRLSPKGGLVFASSDADGDEVTFTITRGEGESGK